MGKLPRITGAVAKRAFEKAGFARVRMKGSHAIMKKAGHPLVLSIPLHAGKTMGVLEGMVPVEALRPSGKHECASTMQLVCVGAALGKPSVLVMTSAPRAPATLMRSMKRFFL